MSSRDHILFLESIFQHSPYEIVNYNANHNSYNKNKKVDILLKPNKFATDPRIIY